MKYSLTVLYETHCPYSQQFIAQQLYPILYQQYGERVDITVVPWGNAQRNAEGVVECQHGPQECHGELSLLARTRRLMRAYAARQPPHLVRAPLPGR